MEDLIGKIKNKLDEQYPQINYEIKDNILTVFPANENGFPVGIYLEDKEWVVFCGKLWHEHFNNEEEAFNCFGSCLQGRYRLKLFLRGKVEYKAIMERFDNEKWHGISIMCIYFFPFWKKREIRYKQNNLISSENRREEG